MKPVTLYSKSDCKQCDMTKKVLNQKGITYKEFRIDEDDQALEVAKGLGYLQAPVVVVGFEHPSMGGEHWSGFQPDKLRAL